MFKTIEKEAEAIIVEKRSKFIANIFYVESEDEAEKILNDIRRKYHDAKHHCFAYRINEEGRIIQKQSDDGEPSGTAGSPMLNILEKKELVNVLLVVTRYFGGVLLGTGGLVKAYSDSSKSAIENSKEVIKEEGYIVEAVLDYENTNEFEHMCKQYGIIITKKEYAEKIKFLLEISKEDCSKIVEKNLKNNFQKITFKIKEEKYINKM